ncbi:MAG: PSD1 domain-containing protein [Planctomycetia bacterium]|nr:PSD1 domain-containing protein [Planctomycetia bacterium]
MPFRSCLAFLVLCIAAVVGLRAGEPSADKPAAAKPTPEQEAYFEKTIRPILVARCLECHGDKKQEGDLRLDSGAGVLKGNDSGPAVVAGRPEESRLIEVIGYKDPIRMPPKQKLTDDEIAAITNWVKIGAPYPQPAVAAAPALGEAATPVGIAKARAGHWSYQPLRRAEPPAVKDGTWGAATIDRFVLADLEKNNLSPSSRADRRTLLRRASFDLVGLPPTAAEVAAFEQDSADDAFARVVDRLLASPQYGERWGRHWLDVARYADTKGYVFTEERKYPFSYTYRDYVIRAFNNDLPFDRFIIEQLAADQLPMGDDKTYLAAMGFLTVGRRFGNNQLDIIDDRIDVVTRGLLGLTVACARCHDHKYDPIPTDDYYSLSGVFASSVEPGDLPQIGAPAMNDAYREYERELGKLEGETNAFIGENLAALVDELRTRTADALAVVADKDARALPDAVKLTVGSDEARRMLVTRWRDYLAETAKQPHPVFGPWHELARHSGEEFAPAAAKMIEGLNDAADAQPRTNALVKQALAASPPKSMADVAGVYGKLLADVHQQWVKQQAEKPADGKAPAAALPDAAAEELRQVLYAEKNPTAISRDEFRRFVNRAVRDKLNEKRRAVESFKANSPAAPPRAMVMNDAPQPAQPHVLIRGNAGRPGKEVPRRFLQVLAGVDGPAFQKGSGRLELAQAIASPSNPLTARVIVNRVWMHHFGKGLVATPSDFGFRGSEPSHPELLDHLAAAFIDEGWSLKKLHRRILLSNAWQQASDDRPECVAADPENRLIWKMNRQRLEFEPMRDALLAVAGRLDATPGGRPVDLFASPFSARRAVYGFIDRQDLPGTFRVFDFASPDVSTPMRPQTTVPQQALFGMNSPLVVEQARALAARPEVQQAADPAARVDALHRLIYARAADAEETAAALKFLSQPQESERPLPSVWQYGYGEYDEGAHQVRNFTALPHFQEGMWRGGAQLPDPKLGWLLLTAQGGHPGGNKSHVIVRRWRAKQAGRVSIEAMLSHPAEQGDGVRGRVISSRAGELGGWTVHHGEAPTKLDGVEVQEGETLDFVVDCLANESNDSFAWSPAIVLTGTDGQTTLRYNAASDFRGPAPSQKRLSPLEQYAQALLLANEFLFVD